MLFFKCSDTQKLRDAPYYMKMKMRYGEFDSQLKVELGDLRTFDMNPRNRLRVALVSLASHGQLPASASHIWLNGIGMWLANGEDVYKLPWLLMATPED